MGVTKIRPELLASFCCRFVHFSTVLYWFRCGPAIVMLERAYENKVFVKSIFGTVGFSKELYWFRCGPAIAMISRGCPEVHFNLELQWFRVGHGFFSSSDSSF